MGGAGSCQQHCPRHLIVPGPPHRHRRRGVKSRTAACLSHQGAAAWRALRGSAHGRSARPPKVQETAGQQMVLLAIQIETSSPEQRVGVQLQRAIASPIRSALNQPVPVARIQSATCCSVAETDRAAQFVSNRHRSAGDFNIMPLLDRVVADRGNNGHRARSRYRTCSRSPCSRPRNPHRRSRPLPARLSIGTGRRSLCLQPRPPFPRPRAAKRRAFDLNGQRFGESHWLTNSVGHCLTPRI